MTGPAWDLVVGAQSRPAVHALLEWTAYAVGTRIYLRRRRADPLAVPVVDQWLLLGAAVFGAAFGAIALHVAESPAWFLQQPASGWIAGKSVLGGLLGGTVATELAKRFTGLSRATGDAWVPALAAGLVIGRIGCQLSGPWDMTYGAPTGAAWGWDYGDGVPRWPVAAIEALAVAGLGWALASGRLDGRSPVAGRRFNVFLAGYCVVRFVLEFAKPPFGAAVPGLPPVDRLAGLTAIQWTALAGAAWMARRLVRTARGPRPSPAT